MALKRKKSRTAASRKKAPTKRRKVGAKRK